ncbi:AbiV family abortive infection protein [Roseibium aggregatum]|uniref:AbiV family abortive infection protein n=1 Tax=Roseibium aggregatum TaxID=187304 RepID=UPI0025AC98E5|nr:AbiV family abortive infection protein [Roseibium aggregatum]WJS03245.1 AbiV family abortive infection protein [Roseibium aggregatum]
MTNKEGYSEKKRNLPEYRGTLTPAQAAQGINAANRNAASLAEDARILFESGKLASAISLAALSIEESGKASILRGIILEDDPVALKKEWKRFRDHRSKNGSWILPDLARKGATKLKHLSIVTKRDASHTEQLHSLKMVGLYTDCYADIHWSEPTEIFSEDYTSFVEDIVKRSELLSKRSFVSEKEMEIWVKCLKPVWRSEQMKFGLIQFSILMHQEGLSDTDPEDFAAFLG